MKSLAPLLSLLLISCASESQRQTRWDAVRKVSIASGICSLHHVPLRRSVVYGWSHFDTGTIDPGSPNIAHRRNTPTVSTISCTELRQLTFIIAKSRSIVPFVRDDSNTTYASDIFTLFI
jgi:hypothetical protein